MEERDLYDLVNKEKQKVDGISPLTWLVIIGFGFLFCLSGVLLWKNHIQEQTIKNYSNNIHALEDTVRIKVHTDSSKTYQLQALMGNVSKTFSYLDDKLYTKDSVIIGLQKVIKNYKGKLQSATVFSSNTDVNTIQTTVTVNGLSSIDTNGWYKKISFSSDINLGKWINGNIIAKWDTTILNLKVHNEYSVVVGFEKGVPYGDITTKSPYDSLNKIRTFDVTIPIPKKYSIGITGGYGIMIGPRGVSNGIVVSIGIQRTIIKLPF